MDGRVRGWPHGVGAWGENTAAWVPYSDAISCRCPARHRVPQLDRGRARVHDPWACRGGRAGRVWREPRRLAGPPSTIENHHARRERRRNKPASARSAVAPAAATTGEFHERPVPPSRERSAAQRQESESARMAPEPSFRAGAVARPGPSPSSRLLDETGQLAPPTRPPAEATPSSRRARDSIRPGRDNAVDPRSGARSTAGQRRRPRMASRLAARRQSMSSPPPVHDDSIRRLSFRMRIRASLSCPALAFLALTT